MLKIAITGHRELLNADKVRVSIVSSLQYFKERDSDIQAISALAIGADTIFAQEAIKSGASMKYILPFELIEYEKDFIEADDLIEFKRLIAQNNNQYEVVSTLKTNTDSERKEAYLEAGKKMVDDADIILAVWDGKAANGKGGTGDIVAYAQSKGKELHIIKGTREENVANDKIHQVFRKLDNDAIKYKKKRFVPAWIAGLAAGVIAVVFFAFGLNYHSVLDHHTRFLIACLEFISLIISVCLLLFLAKKWKNKFLENRRNAEYLRSVIWYKEAGIPIPVIKKMEFEVSHEILAIEKQVSKDITSIRNFANAKRMMWCYAHEQINYHEEIRVKPFEKQIKNMEFWFTAIKIIFFSSVLLKFGIEVLEHYEVHSSFCIEDLLPFLNSLVIILPPTYAALEGVKYFNEWKRNIEISNDKTFELNECKNKIFNCKHDKKLLSEAKILRQILESENSDWAKRLEAEEIEVHV